MSISARIAAFTSSLKGAVRRNVEFRYAQKAFIERGPASGAAAKKSGKYVSAATVLGKLARRLDKARKGRAGRTGAKAHFGKIVLNA